MPSIGHWGSAREPRSAPSSSPPAPRVTTRPSRWRSPWRRQDGIKVGVAYDLGRPTAAVRYLLRDLSAIVLEANHDDVLLRTSSYPPVVQRRISGSSGHLSNRAAAALLVEVHHPGLGVVVLAHLSRQCNTADDARATVATALRRAGFGGTLHIADQDEPLGPIPIRRAAGRQLQLEL